MFANAYQGRRVFVTGHTGFKGSWLAAWLTRLGATVGGFSDGIPTEPSHFAAMNLGAHLEDMRGDIRDRRAMLDAVRRFKPEVVFHLAAQALVRKSYEDPAGTFEANMLGTMNVLEAVRATLAESHEVTMADVLRTPLYKWLAQVFLRFFSPLM